MTQFKESVCKPMKYLELFKKRIEKKFGAVATSLPAWPRLLESCRSIGGLAQVRECVQGRVPIEGRNDSNVGVQQARTLVKEMEKMLAGQPRTAEGAVGAAEAGSPPAESGGAPMDMDEAAVDASLEVEEAPSDPTSEAAARAMEEEMQKINIFTTVEALEAGFRAATFSTHKTIFVVDDLTCKLKVPLAHIDAAKKIINSSNLSKFNILVNCGARSDLFAGVCQKLTREFPNLNSWTVLNLRSELYQDKNTRPTITQILQGPDCQGEAIPVKALTMTGKALPYEKLRLRCTDKCCRLRPESERPEEAAENPANAEIEVNADCREQDQAADMEIVEEAAVPEDSVPVPGHVDFSMDGSKRDFTVAVFPKLNRPISVHQKMLNDIGHANAATNVVVLSASAHPSLALAARKLNLKVFCLHDKSGPHSLAHAKVLMEEILFKDAYKRIKKSTAPSTRLFIRAEELQFIEVKAPAADDQIVQLFDIMPDGGSSWRAGLNRNVGGLSGKLAKLLDEELSDGRLKVVTTPKGRSLVARKHIDEGDVICLATCLLHDSVDGVRRQLLDEEGNEVLADCLCEVKGVLKEGRAVSVYGVLVGAARYLQHYQGIGRINAVIKVDTSKGPNDGFLTLVAATRTGQGISPDSEILIGYGPEYDVNRPNDLDNPSAKKVRLTLDDVWNTTSPPGSRAAIFFNFGCHVARVTEPAPPPPRRACSLFPGLAFLLVPCAIFWSAARAVLSVCYMRLFGASSP